AVLEFVAPHDRRLQVRGRQRFEIEKERRAVQLIEDGMYERVDEAPELLVRAEAAVLDLVQELHQAIERVLVAREENLLLVLEVVVEVPLLHLERGGNLLDRRAVVAKLAEGGRRAFQDVDARRGLRVGVARAAAPARAAGLGGPREGCG